MLARMEIESNPCTSISMRLRTWLPILQELSVERTGHIEQDFYMISANIQMSFKIAFCTMGHVWITRLQGLMS